MALRVLPGGLLLQRGHVDYEAVFYVVFYKAVVGLVDLLDGNFLDFGGDVVLSAEVEHFLGFANATNRGARKPVTTK